ncbi:YciI family protein [Bradyrhizobium sp. UFLA01-814]|uniref:YciI family protein n=1 Tax=Bradyrhizobium sp. UFLA01-814 TaxID=3023480 RepID=UPI00398B4FBA
MQYLLLIYRSDAEYGGMNADDRKALSAEYAVYTQSIIQSGHFKGGDGLQPVSTATTVRVRDGKTLTTDGPFAETREQLGGYYLVDAKDLDTALGLAARIPGAKTGSIEVRPVMIYDK